MKKRIAILGSTGSIGSQALEVISSFPQYFEVVGLTAKHNWEVLVQQAQKFQPKLVALTDEDKVSSVKGALRLTSVEVVGGLVGLNKVAAMAEADLVVAALSGVVGLVPVLEAIKAGKDIAIANKEPLVAAGELIAQEAKTRGIKIIPIDSEHSAIFQILAGRDSRDIRKIILTASGGPFYGYSEVELGEVSPEQALAHPIWKMGEKITIDSATLMNKGLEAIESHWLFGIDMSRIEVLIHPQSIVHSMVELKDGCILALLGVPDMRIPILYALSHPMRLENKLPKLDLAEVKNLTFEEPDLAAFPCLQYAYEVIRLGGTAPAVLNAADEVAVEAFLAGKLKFTDIPKVIRKVLDEHQMVQPLTLELVLKVDEWARERAMEL